MAETVAEAPAFLLHPSFQDILPYLSLLSTIPVIIIYSTKKKRNRILNETVGLKDTHLTFSMSLQRHTVEIAFLMFLISRSSSATCYYPDGSASSERPCRDPSLACCPADTYCLTNGLCWNSKKFFVFRGSCRDKSWNDPNCPGFCRQCKLCPK